MDSILALYRDHCTGLLTWRKFPHMVWILHSHSLHKDYATFIVDGVIVVWRIWGFSYVVRERNSWLHNYTQNLELKIDGNWFGIWFHNHDLKLSSRLCTMDHMILFYPLRKHRRFSSFIKDSFGFIVTSECVRLLLLEDTLTAREPLCVFLIFKSIKAEFQELSSLLQLLENFQDLLCVDVVGIWRLKDEFQRPNGLFIKMETTSDQCCFFFFFLLPRLGFIDNHSPSRCVTSQGELWFSIFTSMAALTNGIDSGFITAKIVPSSFLSTEVGEQVQGLLLVTVGTALQRFQAQLYGQGAAGTHSCFQEDEILLCLSSPSTKTKSRLALY